MLVNSNYSMLYPLREDLGILKEQLQQGEDLKDELGETLSPSQFLPNEYNNSAYDYTEKSVEIAKASKFSEPYVETNE